jgi:hypothetical protein
MNNVIKLNVVLLRQINNEVGEILFHLSLSLSLYTRARAHTQYVWEY